MSKCVTSECCNIRTRPEPEAPEFEKFCQVLNDHSAIAEGNTVDKNDMLKNWVTVALFQHCLDLMLHVEMIHQLQLVEQHHWLYQPEICGNLVSSVPRRLSSCIG